MKKSVLFTAFLTAIFWLGACQDKDVKGSAGCLTTQYNQVLFQYDPSSGRLQGLTYPEGNFVFRYNGSGKLAEIQATNASYPVKTDASGNIIETMGYQFKYDDKGHLIQFAKTTGEIDSYRRLEYDAVGNLSKVFLKGLSPFPTDGPPAVTEFLSQGNFSYDTQQTPWQNDKVLQWVVASSVLIPFELVDQAGAYSRHNITGYSIYYAADSSTPRFTSSVEYTYSDNNSPVRCQATGSAGAFTCTYNYLCANTQARD